VAFDDLRVADTRGTWIVAGLAERTALAEKIPALVETDLDRFEAAVLALAQTSLCAAFIELVLLGNELLDSTMDPFVFHLEPPVGAASVVARPQLSGRRSRTPHAARTRGAFRCS